MKALLLFLVVVITAGSCENSDEIQEITSKDLQLQLEEINNLIGNQDCTETSQCNYLAYGSKACGGPQGYLIFSSEVDMDKLKELVDTYTAAEALYNKQNQIISDCSLVSPPQNMNCLDGKCIKID